MTRSLLLLLALFGLGLVGCPGGDDDDSSVGDDDDTTAADDDDTAADDDDDLAVQDPPCPGDPVTCADGAVTDSTVGGEDVVQNYQACSDGEAFWDTGRWTGGDDLFAFTPEGDGAVTITLSWDDDEADLDLFVLGTCDLDPETANCLGASASTEEEEVVNANVVGGTPIYILVDGWDGDEADYTLTIDCPFVGDDDDSAGDDDDSAGDDDDSAGDDDDSAGDDDDSAGDDDDSAF